MADEVEVVLGTGAEAAIAAGRELGVVFVTVPTEEVEEVEAEVAVTKKVPRERGSNV